MKLVGHRGAAGLALENTKESLRAGIKANVDVVEFDVRLTSDNVFVLSHDSNLHRVSGTHVSVRKTPHKELIRTKLLNGESVTTLQEALQICHNKSVFIECKGAGWAAHLYTFLSNYQHTEAVTVISFHYDELAKFHKLSPATRTMILEKTNPFEAFEAARRYGLTGIDLNFWILNPLTYFLARRHKLEVATYTVNNTLLAHCYKLLYPKLYLTTNYPDRMNFVKD